MRLKYNPEFENYSYGLRQSIKLLYHFYSVHNVNYIVEEGEYFPEVRPKYNNMKSLKVLHDAATEEFIRIVTLSQVWPVFIPRNNI
jgi:hypothetical protein